jgi:ppGpp synthetase/RelA/SpoT-type nucleotidyltranferase
MLPVEFEPKQLGIFQEEALKALGISAIPNKINQVKSFEKVIEKNEGQGDNVKHNTSSLDREESIGIRITGSLSLV